jgi:hypothetical protein
MNKQQLMEILKKYMSKPMAYHCLSGKRRPIYDVMYALYKKEGIPLTAWADIKAFIQQHTTTSAECGQEFPSVTKCDDVHTTAQECAK